MLTNHQERSWKKIVSKLSSFYASLKFFFKAKKIPFTKIVSKRVPVFSQFAFEFWNQIDVKESLFQLKIDFAQMHFRTRISEQSQQVKINNLTSKQNWIEKTKFSLLLASHRSETFVLTSAFCVWWPLFHFSNKNKEEKRSRINFEELTQKLLVNSIYQFFKINFHSKVSKTSAVFDGLKC